MTMSDEDLEAAAVTPTIPQAPPTADDTIADLVAKAKAATAKPDPAIGVLSTPKTLTGGRQALQPSQDVSQVPRRHAPAEAAAETLLDLNPAERTELVRLATGEGRFADTSTAKDAHARAALVQAAIKDKAWDVTEDRTPGRVTNTHINGYTAPELRPMAPSPRHPPSRTAQEELLHQVVLRAGGSHFYPNETPRSTPNTRLAVTCKVEGCHRHFLNQGYLDQHVETRHAPRPKPAKAAEIDREQEVELIVSTIVSRISSGAR